LPFGFTEGTDRNAPPHARLQTLGIVSKELAGLDFVERRPTVKMLALGFLLLIGTTLIADGAGFDVPKGYI
jgi:predicted tellurium resistance membrane protein TerC